MKKMGHLYKKERTKKDVKMIHITTLLSFLYFNYFVNVLFTSRFVTSDRIFSPNEKSQLHLTTRR